MNALFIGNSYTARHNLAEIVKAMAEAGDPNLTLDVSQVIYGGRRLVDHWRLGTLDFVRIAALTPDEHRETLQSLRAQVDGDPEDSYARSALARHKTLGENLEAERKTWDIVVLQSYCDDQDGDGSLYAEYAARFAKSIHATGARVVLYETTPDTQNAEPLTRSPDPALVLGKARSLARLANRIDAAVAPMSLAALRCQTLRPDLTLRYINDAHLNKTMAYLTACALYAALFDRSPEGLPVDTVTDIRYFETDGKVDKTKDRDGGPITHAFNEMDRADLQRIAWDAVSDFKKLRAEEASRAR